MKGRAFALMVPFGFEALVPVADLMAQIGRDVASTYCMRLWHHRQRSGALVPGANAARALEQLVGWSRRRGALAAALVEAGLVEEAAEGLRIVDPFELGSVEWMGANVDVDPPGPEAPHGELGSRSPGYLAEKRRIERSRKLSDEEREASLEDLRRRYGVRSPKSSRREDAATGAEGVAQHVATDRNGVAQQATTDRDSVATRTATDRDTSGSAHVTPRAHTLVTGTGTCTSTGTQETFSAADAPEAGATDERRTPPASDDVPGATSDRDPPARADARPPPAELFPASAPAPASKKPRKAATTGIGGEVTRWLERFRELTAVPGETPDEALARAPDTGDLRTRYAIVRKLPGRTPEVLLTALERGLEGVWWGTKTPLAMLSEQAITAGLAPPRNEPSYRPAVKEVSGRLSAVPPPKKPDNEPLTEDERREAAKAKAQLGPLLSPQNARTTGPRREPTREEMNARQNLIAAQVAMAAKEAP